MPRISRRLCAAPGGPRFERTEFERAWDLCWLKAFVQLGYCLIDPLVENPHSADTERVRLTVRRAVAEAKRIHNTYVH